MTQKQYYLFEDESHLEFSVLYYAESFEEVKEQIVKDYPDDFDSIEHLQRCIDIGNYSLSTVECRIVKHGILSVETNRKVNPKLIELINASLQCKTIRDYQNLWKEINKVGFDIEAVKDNHVKIEEMENTLTREYCRKSLQTTVKGMLAYVRKDKSIDNDVRNFLIAHITVEGFTW